MSWAVWPRQILFFAKIFFRFFLMQLSLFEGENLGHPKESCRFIIQHRDTPSTRCQDLARDSNLENLDKPIVGVELEFGIGYATRYAYNYVYFHNMH